MTLTRPLPCPYCPSGRTRVRVWWAHGFHVECPSCTSRGPSRKTERGAVNAWNRVAREVPPPRPKETTCADSD